MRRKLDGLHCEEGFAKMPIEQVWNSKDFFDFVAFMCFDMDSGE